MECLFSTDNKFGPRYEVAWHRIIIVISAPLDNYRAFCALKIFSLDVRKPHWCREKNVQSILSFNIILNFKLCIQVTIQCGDVQVKEEKWNREVYQVMFLPKNKCTKICLLQLQGKRCTFNPNEILPDVMNTGILGKK